MRGGARKGAGRPKLGNKRVYIPSELAQIIDEQGTKAVLEILKRELGK
jgi:hypothetical protein